MKLFPILLVIAGTYGLFHVTIQSFRHVFVLLVEPRTSVLDKYEPAQREVDEAKSLDELVAPYDDARARVKAWEQGKTAAEIQDRQWDEPYLTANRLKEAVQTWEEHHRQIRELNFYWWCGLACYIAGQAVYRRWHPLLGMAFFLVAFAEMIYWTSPAIGGWSGGEEFSRLVLWKLLYSLATLGLILAGWSWTIIPSLRAAAAADRAAKCNAAAAGSAP
ncbi:MAG: hypothetical protein WD872_17775 [Pirellulaceae bacterium]